MHDLSEECGSCLACLVCTVLLHVFSLIECFSAHVEVFCLVAKYQDENDYLPFLVF